MNKHIRRAKVMAERETDAERARDLREREQASRDLGDEGAARRWGWKAELVEVVS